MKCSLSWGALAIVSGLVLSCYGAYAQTILPGVPRQTDSHTICFSAAGPCVQTADNPTFTGTVTVPNTSVGDSSAKAVNGASLQGNLAAYAPPGSAYVSQFGATGDGTTDDWPAAQKGIESLSSHGGGTLIFSVPAVSYRLAQALRMRSNVRVYVQSPSTVINCTGDANYSDASVGLPAGGVSPLTGRFPFNSCVLFGTSDQTDVNNNLPTAALNSVAIGATVVTPTSAGLTSGFAAGDQVMVEASTVYTPFSGSGNYPSNAQFNRVVSRNGSTGALTLLNPMTIALASAEVRDFTTTGGVQAYSAPGGPSGVPFFTSYKASVVGGSWVASNGHFATGGGALDCEIAPASVTSTLYDAVVMNTLTGCRVDIQKATVAGQALEAALFSSHSTFNFGSIVHTGPASGATPAIVRVNEGSYDNTIDIGSISLAAPAANLENVIQVNRALDNTVHVGSVTGVGTSNPAVVVQSLAVDSGSIYPAATGNRITVDKSNLGTQSVYAQTAYADSARNIVSGAFTGAVTNGSGYSLLLTDSAGASNMFLNITGQNGTSYCDSGTINASNMLVNVTLNGVNQASSVTCGAFTPRVPGNLLSNAGATLGNIKTIFGTISLDGSGNGSVTLSGAAVFSSTYSYGCAPSDLSGGASAASVSNQSASSFNVYGTASHTLTYTCTGY